MSKSYDWTIYVINSDGTTWSLDTSLPRPNQNIEKQINSTVQTITLANGGEAYITPEIRRTKGSIEFFWADTTAAFRNQIEEYINFGEKVKIVTHDNQIIYGRFMSYIRVWFAGSVSQFDISVTFKESDS
jgi:hypothetical protein